MEVNKIEVLALQKSEEQAAQEQVKELNDLQLAIVGGGSGEVVFA